jgi:N-acetylglutamate synthase-like GNAT family acetyltransferase
MGTFLMALTDIVRYPGSDTYFVSFSGLILHLFFVKTFQVEIRIIPYRTEHFALFKQLNLEWLDHYQLTESHDLLVLDDPEGTILEKGGFIWMAEADGKIVGSVALMKEEEGVYELAKMTVTQAYRGKGISRLLIERALYKAREIGARKVTLFSNHQLQTAIGLYQKYGFRHVAFHDSPFETADIRMELIL